MIEYTKGNLLDANTQALVNTVNTVGVMGKGIALQFKETFPGNTREYLKASKAGLLAIGKLLVVREQTLSGERIIINFPTKTSWHLKSKYEYIESGLKELVKTIKVERIGSIALPPLGCGNGGLEWNKVKILMEKYLSQVPNTKVVIYQPSDAVRALLKLQAPKREVNLTPARAMLLYALFYYEASGETSSLFVANKLAYFLQRLGEKLRLKFEPGHFGPYSVQVGHVLHALNGKYIRGLEQMNMKAFEQLELNYERFDEIDHYVNAKLSTEQRERLSNLVRFIEGYQSALSLEVLASVDFLKSETPGISEKAIIQKIRTWSERKRHLVQERYVSKALAHLDKYSKQIIVN